MKTYFVYILASRRNGTLYVGVTNDLVRRKCPEHKNDLVEGFSQEYAVHKLVYFEACGIKAAIEREKRIKKWNRQWKIELIEKNNPEWNDLYPSIVDGLPLSRE